MSKFLKSDFMAGVTAKHAAGFFLLIVGVFVPNHELVQKENFVFISNLTQVSGFVLLVGKELVAIVKSIFSRGNNDKSS